MKRVTQSLVKGKKTCPFIQRNFDIDVKDEPINKTLVKTFGEACPYLTCKKVQKKTSTTMEKISNLCTLQEECQNSSKCPYSNPMENMQKYCDLENQKIDQVKKFQQEFDYNQKFSQQIDDLKGQNRYRYFNYIERIAGEYPKANLYDENGLVKKITVWCSNDYLGMGQMKNVQDAMIDSIKDQGIGAGGTRNIGGSSLQHILLEKDLANFHDKESALLCTSCFVANQAAMNALARVMPDIVYLSDEKNHASLIEGIKNSRAEKEIWKHNDLYDLEQKLKQYDINKPKCIVFESVYSMSGNIAPIDEICELAKKYNALTFIDEVHAIGLYGSRGGGVAQQLGIDHKLDFISGTLSKGVGCFGGYIVGNTEAIDCIRSFAPNFIFTTSIPPSVAAANREALKVISEQQHLRDRLHEVSFKIKKRFYDLGIRMEPSVSHIVPVFVGDAKKVKSISDMLLNEFSIYIQPINYPTVNKGEELLRISPTPNHTDEMIDDLCNALLYSYKVHGLKLYKGDEIFISRGDKKINMEHAIPFDMSSFEAFFMNKNVEIAPQLE